LRRQYAIESLPWCRPKDGPRHDIIWFSREAARHSGEETLDFRCPGHSVAPNRPLSDHIGGSRRGVHPCPGQHQGNHETINKSKGPDKVRAFCRMGLETLGEAAERGLFVLFGLLFRRRQAFEALQELFLGHALDRDLGVVGIDAGPG
jgi:hypothetical protein